MNISEQINVDFLTAYKGGDRETADALKMFKAALDYKEKEAGKPLDENETIAVLRKEEKKRLDAAEQYKAGGRNDLAEKELKEVKLIEKYLPTKISEEEIEEKVKAKIKELNAGIADFGKVMKELMIDLSGQVDGGVLSGLVKKNLL